MSEVTVGIRDLRNQLSAYLERVKDWDTLIITERGKPIGRIIPEARGREIRIQRLIDAGLAEWSGCLPEIRDPEVVNRADILLSDLISESGTSYGRGG